MAAAIAANAAANAEKMAGWMADVMAALQRAHETGAHIPASKACPRPASKILPLYGCTVPPEEIANVLDHAKDQGLISYSSVRRDGKDRVDVRIV